MRRKEKEITDIKSIEEIINKAKVCRLALSLDDTPYVVPVCFGYNGETIYIHSAKEGQNILERIATNIRKNLKSLVFDTVIPESVLFSEASSAGKPIVIHDSKSIGALSYP